MRFSSNVAGIIVGALSAAHASASLITLDFTLGSGGTFFQDGFNTNVEGELQIDYGLVSTGGGFGDIYAGLSIVGGELLKGPHAAARTGGVDVDGQGMARIHGVVGTDVQLELSLFSDMGLSNPFTNGGDPFSWAITFLDIDGAIIPNYYDEIVLKTPGSAIVGSALNSSFDGNTGFLKVDGDGTGDVPGQLGDFDADQMSVAVGYTVNSLSTMEFDWRIQDPEFEDGPRSLLIAGQLLVDGDSTVVGVPLPNTLALLLLGIFGFAYRRHSGSC